MKTMQKFLAATIISLFMVFPNVSAQTGEPGDTMVEDFLPASIDILYQLKTSQQNPVEGFIQEFLSSELMPENEDQQAAYDAITEVFADNTFTLAMEMTEENTEVNMEDSFTLPRMFLSFHVNEVNFEHFMTLSEGSIEEIPTETYLGQTIYKVDEDFFVQYLDGLLLATSELESAHALVDNSLGGTDTLSNNSMFTNARSHFLNDAFFNLYIDPAFATDSMTFDPLFGSTVWNEGLKEEMLLALTSEAVSVSQTDEGFSFSAFVEGDLAMLQQLNMLFDKYNFIPALYKDISGSNIILYMEHSDAASWLADLRSTFTEDTEFTSMYEEFMTTIDAELGINVETELLPLLKGNNAFAMHHAEQLFPAMTMLFDVQANRAEVGTLITTINQNLRTKWEKIEETEGTDLYDYSISYAGNTALYTHTFNTEDMGKITLRMGVTFDGRLVISTHPELADVFRSDSGMTASPSFAEVFSNSEEIASLIYLNFRSLYDYIRFAMVETDATQEDLEWADAFAAAWHDLYVKTYGEANKSWAIGMLRVDVEKVIGLDELLFGPTYDYDFEETPFPMVDETETGAVSISFCDVQSQEWFYPYVTSLAEKTIVQGYGDGCFRPNNEVTRAEFVKMAVEGADFSGVFPWSAMSDEHIFFDDVQPGEWFSYYINQAAAIGYVEGYGDGTFHPNDPISRAEAVQILYNMSNILRQEELKVGPFNDVSPDDWFSQAVGTAFSAGLVQGRSTNIFDPHANITRAESAKIVDLFISLY